MQGQIPQEVLDAIQRFPAVAQDFCRFIDNCADTDRQRLVSELPARLARLCETAAYLPWAEPATEGKPHTEDEIATHTMEWKRLEGMLRPKFGNLDNYWEIFDPTEKEDPVQGSLASDIAEIYLDLKDGLNLLESGIAAEDVLFEWRLDFRQHWFRHAVNALKVTLSIADVA